MTLTLRIPEQHDLSPRITVFGVGGAGGNAVNNMIVKKLEGAEFVVANTDAQALQQSASSKTLQLGTKVTEGLGAGAKPELGTLAAEESIEQIVDILEGSHLCFITAGMGGGTGTGAAPVIAQAARQLGVLTVGVVTKPFQFEGIKRMRQAEAGIEELQKVVDTLIIIPNQNLFRLANEKTTFTDAFSLADDVLYQGVKGVTDLMVRPGLINLDFADVRSVMDEMGKAMMGTGESIGEDRAIEAAEKAIANPLLDEISLKGARGVLINITGGHDLTLFELDEAANRIRSEVDPEANIIVGSTLDAEMEGSMRVSVVATGIETQYVTREEENLEIESKSVQVSKLNAAEESPELASTNKIVEGINERSATSTVEQGFHSTTAHYDDLDVGKRSQQLKSGREFKTEGFLKESNVKVNREAEVNVSQSAKDRLMEAVRKNPDNSDYRHTLDKVDTESEKHSGGKFNSLIQRMTGNKDKFSERKGLSSSRELPSLSTTEPRANKFGKPNDEEKERLEIPAFLRRQAN